MPEEISIKDIFVIGGGINGCGIARDAAGRGLSVTFAEMGDLGGATSSSSTKLFHGGLRYLGFFEFRLVSLALKEREILLSAIPQISWPMRFLLPCHRDMRFDSDTPTSRLLSFVMPWMKGRWPAWLIRLGLSLCDHLGRGKIIPGTSTLDLASCSEGTPLQDKFSKVCEYSDCWVEDARLVALNARDAKLRDADILTHTKVTRAERKKEVWEVARDNGQTHFTRTLVNPGGPWVAEIARGAIRQNSKDSARLIRGSHIVTKKLFDHEKCYFFQGTDGRIIFAIPYETGFTLIGTTDSDHPDPSTVPECSPEEADYLGRFASQYIKKTISKNEIVWTYSSVRRFYDNGAASATAATRDYVLEFDTNGAPLLNVLGGKITTNRKLSELAVEKIAEGTETWSAGAALPGDEFPVDGVRTLIEGLLSDYSFLTPRWAKRLFKAYGTDARILLGNAQDAGDLGWNFGADLTKREVLRLMEHEFVQAPMTWSGVAPKWDCGWMKRK